MPEIPQHVSPKDKLLLRQKAADGRSIALTGRRPGELHYLAEIPGGESVEYTLVLPEKRHVESRLPKDAAEQASRPKPFVKVHAVYPRSYLHGGEATNGAPFPEVPGTELPATPVPRGRRGAKRLVGA